jgi:uncharacterized protein YndB with AHSA1/START domain
MSFTLTLQIDRSVEDVFEYIADYRTTPEWYSVVKKVEKTAGGMGVGTRYRVTRDALRGTATHQLEISKYELNKEVEFTSVDEPTPFSYRYLVEPAGDSTNLVLEATISAGTGPGATFVLTPIAETLFKRGMRENLGELKKILDAGADA